jgi:hypothetical protein
VISGGVMRGLERDRWRVWKEELAN